MSFSKLRYSFKAKEFKMKIITYHELESKDDFMLLMDQAFWMPVAPSKMREFIQLDIRLRNGPVGFCTVEDGRLAGFVGIMDIPTKTVSGKKELVGGIWCVATNPGLAKKGICKTLMDRAHQYFQEKGYPFSFLFTLRTIIAYAIYLKMSYVEVERVNQYPKAYKVFGEGKVGKRIGAKLNHKKIYDTYQEFTSDKTGFVVRQKDFVRMFSLRKRFDEKKSIQMKSGYALLTELRNVIKIQELISLDEKNYDKLLDQVESFTTDGVLDRMVTDEKLLKIYKKRGYKIQDGDNEVFMVKKLGEAEFGETFGDAFHIGYLDGF